jgi:hypothetical protein
MSEIRLPQKVDVPMSPKRPRMEPKTSTMRMRTNKPGSAASEIAAVEPVMPTVIPQKRLQRPTVRPPQKRAYPIQSAHVIKVSLTANGFRNGHTGKVVLSGVEVSIVDIVL